MAAQLIRLSKANGEFRGAIPGTAVSSNLSFMATPTNLTARFDHAFNYADFYHYVRVDMNRAVGTTHIATFYGAAVECR